MAEKINLDIAPILIQAAHMQMKYIIDEIGGFMIFSEYVRHDDAARCLVRAGNSEIVGAGFIDLTGGFVSCFGKSQSMNVNSGGRTDEEKIAAKLGLQPYSKI